MRGWLLANLFLLSIPAIGGGFLLLFGATVKALPFGPDLEPYAMFLACVAALVATFYVVKRVHALIERRLNRAR